MEKEHQRRDTPGRAPNHKGEQTSVVATVNALTHTK